MDLVHYLRTLRRRWRIIVVAAVLGAVVAFLVVPQGKSTNNGDQATVYLATQRFIANQTSTTNNSSAALSLDQMKLLISAGDVPQRVAARLGGDPSSYADRVHTVVNPQLRTLEVTAKGQNADETQELVDVVGEELLAAIRDLEAQRIAQDRDATQAVLQQYQSQYDAVQGDDAVSQARKAGLLENIRSTEEKLRGLDTAGSSGDPLTTLSQTPPIPVTPAQAAILFKSDNTPASSKNSKTTQPLSVNDLPTATNSKSKGTPTLLVLGGGAFAGALLAVALILTAAALDPRIFTKEQAEAAFGFPVIAEVPAFTRRQRRETEIISRTAPYSRFAEAFRVLRSSILFVERSGRLPEAVGAGGPGPDEAPEKKAAVVMVTSPGPAEGKTTTASNLAAVLAEDGSRVLVVNCDFRRPRLHLFLGTDHQSRKVIDTSIPGVKFVAGVVDDHRTATPAEVVKAQRDVVVAARDLFDYIILDTAPLLTTNDASDVLAVTDMVIVVCRSGKTTKEAADRAAELLERFNAPVIGAALIAAVDAPSARYYYYYATDEQQAEPPDTSNPLADLAGPDDEPSGGDADMDTDAGADSPMAGESPEVTEDGDGKTPVEVSPATATDADS